MPQIEGDLYMSKKKLGRRSTMSAPWLLALAAASVGIVISLGAATASNAASRSAAIPPANGAMQRVVVLLRNKSGGASPRSAAHLRALRARIAPLVHALRSAG